MKGRFMSTPIISHGKTGADTTTASEEVTTLGWLIDILSQTREHIQEDGYSADRTLQLVLEMALDPNQGAKYGPRVSDFTAATILADTQKWVHYYSALYEAIEMLKGPTGFTLRIDIPRPAGAGYQPEAGR
jgi:hypothetical protein